MRRLLVLALFLTPACNTYDDRGNLCPSGRTVWDTSSDKGVCWRQCYAGHRTYRGLERCLYSGCGYQKVCK